MIQSFQLPSTSNNRKESTVGVDESPVARQPTSWCKDLLGKFDTLWEKKNERIKERATRIGKKDKRKIHTLGWIQIYAPPVEWANQVSLRFSEGKILASNIPRPSISLSGDGYRARKRLVRRKHARAWPTCSLGTTNAANTKRCRVWSWPGETWSPW